MPFPKESVDDFPFIICDCSLHLIHTGIPVSGLLKENNVKQWVSPCLTERSCRENDNVLSQTADVAVALMILNPVCVAGLLSLMREEDT